MKKAEYKKLKKKFMKIYHKLPDIEQTQVIAVVDSKPYSWNVVYIEVENDTALSKRMLDKIRERWNFYEKSR